MEEYDIEFFEYLIQAQLEALKDREFEIFGLRYGLTGESPYSLEAIAEIFKVSRERIRQILNKAHRKILFAGKKQIKLENFNAPSAKLLTYITSIIRPEEAGFINRFVEFTTNKLSILPSKTHSFKLITHLLYFNKNTRNEVEKNAIKLLRENLREIGENQKTQESISKFKALLSYVIQPEQMKPLENFDLSLFDRKREVSLEGYGNAGEFYSEKISKYVQYESGLEMKFLSCLENSDNVVYYSEQPIRLPYQFYNKTYFYYPDFVFFLNDNKGIVVEIKPLDQMALKINLVKWAALKEYCTQNGLGLLVTDGKYAIQQIMKYESNLNFANTLLAKLGEGSLNWNQYKEIREQFNPSTKDFASLIMRNKLTWLLNPFSLSL
jgi:Sigma-70, region 4